MKKQAVMKKCLGVLFLTVAFLIFVGAANATTMYADRASWEAAVGAFMEFTDYGDTGYPIASGTGIDVGYGETLSFDHDMSVHTINWGWATWSGGYTGDVLYTDGAVSVTGTFGDGGLLGGFGLEAEPEPFSDFDINLLLADGSILTQSVAGDSGAKFFGYTTDIAIMSLTVSSATDFAIGRFVSTGSSVPEPSTMLLLGAGLVGLVGAKRKLKK